MPILLMGGIFVCVMLGIVLLGAWLMQESAETGATELNGILAKPSPAISKDFFEDTVAKVGQVVPIGEKATRTGHSLRIAGYRGSKALATFHGIKASAAVGLGLMIAIIAYCNGVNINMVLMDFIAGAGIGYLLPHRILEMQIKHRCQRLRNGLPVAIDLIVLGLEAGQSLDAAITEAGRELRNGFPEIAQELAWVQMEMYASKSRSEAFRNLSERNAEPEIKRFAQVLVDCDRFGTSLGPALRSQVKYLRIRIRQQAREAARKVGVKLVFPVFFLIFPSVLLVTLGPAVLQITTQLTPLMLGTK